MNREKTLYTSLAISSLAFAFFWLPAPRMFDIAQILLILLFVPAIAAPANRELRQDPVIRLGLAFFLYVVVSIVWHRLTLPENFPPTTSDRRFLRVLYFVAIAYTIARSNLLTPWRLLGVGFFGLLFYLGISFDQAEWMQAWHGKRVDFGMQNAQHTGIVFAAFALAFSAFTPRFFSWTKGVSPLAASFLTPLWIAALLLSFGGVFASQTRAVWLGLSLVLVLLPFIVGFACTLQGRPLVTLRKPGLTGVAGVVLFGLLAAGSGLPGIVSERLSAEKVTWESLRLAATHEDQNLSSIEVRVASWSAAVEWIRERPLMGWGGRGSRPLIDQSDLFSDAFKETFNHLHNSYLQVLVEIGLIGAGFITALIFLLGRASIKGCQRRAMPLDVFIFSWLFFIFWLVVNLFESYIIYPSGTYLVAIVAAFFYSFCIRQKPVS